ncbi:MAG: hypothetical protein L0Z55_08270 [Planctomycetes bacterium]|nr:hypothetical protein [Planctomycetota bacterium]
MLPVRRLAVLLLSAAAAGCASGAKPEPPAQASASRIAPARNPAAGVRVLHIRSGPGFLRVIGTPGTEISAEGKIYAQAANLPEAERLCNDAQVRLHLSDPTEPVLETTGPRIGTASQSYRIDVTVAVPPGIRVSVRDEGGDLSVQGLAGGLAVQHGGGTLTITDVAGGLEVQHRGTATKIAQIGGKIAIDDGEGDLELANVTGHAEIRGGGGALVIRNVEGNVTVRDNCLGVAVSGVSGELNLYDIEPSALDLQACPGAIHFLKSPPR